MDSNTSQTSVAGEQFGGVPFTKATRAVVEGLTAIVARRAREHAVIKARREQEIEVAETRYREAAEAATAQANLARHAAEAAYKAVEESLTDEYRDSIEEATASMERELRAFNTRTDEMDAASRRELEDAGWLADATLESGEAKLAKEHDAFRKSVLGTGTQLTELENAAQQMLHKFGHAPLPLAAEHAESGSPATGATEIDFATLRRECEAAMATPGSRLVALRHAANPPLGSDPALVFGGVGGVILGAVLGGVLVHPVSVKAIALGGGAGLIVAMMVLVPLRLALKRRVPAASAAFVQSVAESRARLDGLLAAIEARRLRMVSELRAKIDREFRSVKEAYGAARRKIDQRRAVEGPALEQKHDLIAAGLRDRLAQGIAAARAECLMKVQGAERARDATIQVAIEARDAATDAVEALTRRELEELERDWQATTRNLYAIAAELNRAVAQACPAWSEIAEGGVPMHGEAPPGIGFGSIEINLADVAKLDDEDSRFGLPGPAKLSLPIGVDLVSCGSVLVHAAPDSRGAAISAVQDLMLRLVTSLPPGKVRFTIIDPVGLGQNFAAFMHLADHDPLIVGDRIWTDARHIEQKLTDLTEHMENVIQKYLRNEFPTIQDYNRQAGEVAEPFRFLVIADFPANFSEPAAKRLAAIATSGARCGVFTIIAQDTRNRPPAWLPIGDIERSSLVISHKQQRFAWADEVMSRWSISLEAPPPDEMMTAILNAAGKAAVQAGRVQVPFAMIAPPAGEMWCADSAHELRVPLGRAGATKLRPLVLGRGTAQHVLIAGRTGSGKSTLLHALITNAALWYSPEQLELYLVDFKKGVEFKVYATHGLPHARVIAVESEREFGLSVLRRLDSELTRRGGMFRDAGVQDVASFRRQSGQALARVLLIVDEFQEFFSQDDRIAQEASLLLDRLVRQGRAFGVHVVLGSQTIGGVYSLARSTIGQMAVRIALQCSEADSYLIMSEDNSAPRLLTRPGEAIYNDASGQIEGNSPFQVSWLSDEEREDRLRDISDRLRESGLPEPPAPIVFEGNVPSDIGRNTQLGDLLEGRSGGTGAPRAALGEAISIKEPTSAPFARQATSNLLIVGQQDLPALAVSTAIVVGLAAHLLARPGDEAPMQSGTAAPGVPPITILDGVTAEDAQVNPLASIAAALPRTVARGGVRDAEPLVGNLAQELERRMAAPHGDYPPCFLLVHGLQRFRALRKAEESFGFGGGGDDAATDAATRLDKLLREGPPMGMHTIVWSNTATTLERSLDRRTLREFDGRVLFQMSAADSTYLIDGPQAGTLGAHRAIYFSEETGVIEKFRPYALPSDAWLAWALGRLSAADATRV